MVGNKDFSQYLAEARAKQGVAVPNRGVNAGTPSYNLSAFKKAPAAKGQDPLSWFVDILSRPMRTVENVPNQILNEELKRKQAKETGTQYNELGGIVNILTAPVRGFFSNNPEDQPTGAQLIEKEYDVRNYGKLGYKDVENNVNEFQKGAGGLALDIALDPLTWIPGAQYAKAGQMIGRGAKGALEAADLLVAGSNVGDALGASKRIASREAAKVRTAKIDNANLNADLAAQRTDPQLAAFTGYKPSQAVSDVYSPSQRLARLTTPETAARFEVPRVGAEVPLAPVRPPKTKAEKAASAKLTQALKAEDIAPVLPDEAVASASLMDRVGPPVGSTEGEQFATKANVPAILDILDSIKSKTVTAVETPAKSTEELTRQLAALKDREKQLTTVSRGTASASPTAEARRVAQVEAVQAEIKSIEKDLKATNPKRAAEVTTKFSAAAVLKEKLADPVEAARLTEALSPEVVEGLSKITNSAQLVRATDFLGRVVRGETPKTSSSIQSELAQNIRKHYDIKVPGTEAPAISGTSSVGTERAAEAAVVHEAGMNLRDVPWLGSYSQEQIDLVSELLPKYLLEDFLNTNGYSYITKRGALSTSETAGDGLHKFANEFNQMDQYSLAEALIKDARKQIAQWNKEVKTTTPALMVAGAQRASRLKDETLKLVDLSFQWLDSKGVSIWMGIDDTRIRLYLHQMLDTLNEAARTSKVVKYDALDAALFNTATSVPLTNMMDAVVALYRNPAITDKELLGLLKKPIKGADNFLLQSEPQRWKHYLPGTAPKGIKLERNLENGVYKGDYGLIEPDKFGDDLVTMLREAAPDMEKVVLHNEEMALARAIADQENLSAEVVDELFRIANNPAELGESVRKIANIPVFVGEKGASNWAMPKVSPIVAKPATDYWPNDVVNDAQLIQKLVKAGAKNDREALVAQTMQNGEYMSKTADEIVRLRGSMFEGVDKNGNVINPALFEDAVDEQALNMILEAGRTTKFQQLFQYSKGKEQVIHPFNQANIQLSKAVADFKMNVNKLVANNPEMLAGGTSVIKQAFNDIAVGVNSGPQVVKARKELEPLIWAVFGKPGDSEAMGIWQRAGASIEDLQVYMKKNKLDYTIDLAAANKKMAEGQHGIEAALEDWKLWAPDIDSPLQFLSDMYFAGTTLHVDKSAAALLAARAGVTSAKPRAGYVKIPALDLFKHPIMGHLPKNTYIREDILQEVNNLERMVMSDYSPKSEFGKFLNEKYLPVLGAWKKGVTIYRLGHHARNLISSEGIQWTVEGTRYYTSSASDAMRVLMTHKSYEGVDWAKNVESLVQNKGRLEMPTGGTKLFDFGKTPVTVDALYEAANKHGLFTDFRMIEDLFADGANGSFEKFINKISFKDTALERMAGGLSEYQAHFSRLHHFAQILRKEAAKAGKKNWDDVVEKAAIKVRRHHPDGVTLTPFEQQVMKPLIPFYSWFRQIMPIIAEGIAQNPGRFMVYPKVSYNLAVAMGVNPESLQDPFPTDTLFPDFVTDQLTGPVAQIDGNYFKASPGYAYADVLNQFVADPTKGAISMITPFIKTPGELITGTRWDTGVSIKDYSDYIDAQLPGVNYLSNFTGVSTSGSLASLITGNGIDMQYAVDKGNKTVLDQGLSVFNWFSGLGLQNISKENYQNLAEIQKRNAAAEEARREAGTARNPF